MIQFNSIAIRKGHQIVGVDSGTNGISTSEDLLVREVGNRVIDKLRNLGKNVYDVTPKIASSVSHSLGQGTSMANSLGANLFLSIHANSVESHKGYGVECWVNILNSEGRKIGEEICSSISELGFYNRGLKDGKNLYEINNTRMTAVLVELCFIDNENDNEILQRIGYDDFANKIVFALTGVKVSPTPYVPPLRNNLQLGSEGEDVFVLQKRLKHFGTIDLDCKYVDGDFGKLTQSAVMNFQRARALPINGVVDITFWNELFRE
jgi:N-acetylmuramoyl-L-alanine amidase